MPSADGSNSDLAQRILHPFLVESPESVCQSILRFPQKLGFNGLDMSYNPQTVPRSNREFQSTKSSSLKTDTKKLSKSSIPTICPFVLDAISSDYSKSRGAKSELEGILLLLDRAIEQGERASPPSSVTGLGNSADNFSSANFLNMLDSVSSSSEMIKVVDAQLEKI